MRLRYFVALGTAAGLALAAPVAFAQSSGEAFVSATTGGAPTSTGPTFPTAPDLTEITLSESLAPAPSPSKFSPAEPQVAEQPASPRAPASHPMIQQ